MTTDITELAQRMKAAAESVIKNHDCEWFETGRQICTVHKSKVNLISMANPSNIIALVEALENANRYIERLREWNAGLAQESCERQQRISELLQGKVGGALLEREKHHVELVGKLTENITELESEVEKWKQEAETWEHVAEKQLATAIELESRTVKLPPLKVEAE
ncbi:TPA: hypothetical protein ACTW34_002845 [Raoultella planticola]